MASRAGPSSGSRSSATPAPPRPSSAAVTAKSTTDPVLRNALRYTISAREYALLHKYVISRSRVLKRRAPTVDSVQRMMEGDEATARSRAQSVGRKGKGREKAAATSASAVGTGADDYNARAVRHALRVFMATGTAMKLWELLTARLMGRKAE